MKTIGALAATLLTLVVALPTVAQAQGFPGLADCKPGSYLNGKVCTPCAPGYYTKQAKARLCIPCPAGTFAPSPGAVSCMQCPPGRTSIVGQAACAPVVATCPQGQAPMNGTCVACMAGTYAAGNECKVCPPGQFSAKQATMACSPCAAGTFSAGPGSIQCSPCPPGRTSKIGSNQCEMAPTAKACPPGQALIDGACKACPTGALCK